MIGIGSSIGMGLWLGSRKGLATGGPAALFLGWRRHCSELLDDCRSQGRAHHYFLVPCHHDQRLGVRVFGEVEVVMPLIKFGWFFIVVIALIVNSAGGAPNDEAVGFRYWNETPFINGFVGFLNVLPICVFALSGSETTGMVAAKASNPRKYMPRAVNAI
ncbi:hypothetical protein H9Q70_000369 [Fusarium xylarioides]|nr:hypothetical protein H9Q70_000369 [Fusarium xylarioides]